MNIEPSSVGDITSPTALATSRLDCALVRLKDGIVCGFCVWCNFFFLGFISGGSWIRLDELGLQERLRDTLKLDFCGGRGSSATESDHWSRVECGCSSLVRPLLDARWRVDRSFLTGVLCREWSESTV